MVELLQLGMVIGFAFGLSLLSQVINKLMINERRTDKNREEMKKIQGELKGLDPKSKEFSEKQNRMLDINMEIMKQQFKPMLFTFVPYIFIFYLMSSMLAYAPIAVGTTVGVNILGSGNVFSDCLNLNQTVTDTFNTAAQVKSETCKVTLGSSELDLDLVGKQGIVEKEAGGMKLRITPPGNIYIPLPVSLPIVGDSLGWLGTFVLFSFISSLILSKLLKGRYLRKWAE